MMTSLVQLCMETHTTQQQTTVNPDLLKIDKKQEEKKRVVKGVKL